METSENANKLLKAAASLTKWCIQDAEEDGTFEHAIHNLKRIYAFLVDKEMEE